MATSFSKYHISESEVRTNLLNLRFLKKVSTILNKISSEQEEMLLRNMEHLVTYLPVYSRPICLGNELRRISINESIRDDSKNGRLNYITQLKYPPLEKSNKLNYNRASMKKQSIFYSGLGMLNTSIENPAKTGQLITESIWKQKSGTTVTIVPIFQNLALINHNPDSYLKEWEDFNQMISAEEPHVSNLIKEIYSFITAEFLKPVKNKIEHLFSAYFANAFYERGVEVIAYPSVPNDYFAENIVITPSSLDTKFDFIEAREDLVVNDPTDSAGTFEKVLESIRKSQGVNVGNPKTTRGWQVRNISIAKQYDNTSSRLMWETKINENELDKLKTTFSFDLS